MECCQKLHPQFIVFKEQRSSLVCQMLAMAICESTYSPPATDHFDAETPAVKGEEKCPIKSVKNPHETRILPNSRARIWPNLGHKRAFYEYGSRSAGMYVCMCIYIYVCMYVCMCIYIYTYVCVHMPIYIVIIV